MDEYVPMSPEESGRAVEVMRDEQRLKDDRARFAQKHIRTLEGVTILSVGGRDKRLNDDHVVSMRLANGQTMTGVMDAGRFFESEQAVRAVQAKTNVFQDDANTPLQASVEGTFTQVRHQFADRTEWVFWMAQADVAMPDGSRVRMGRPLHPATHDIEALDISAAKETRAPARKASQDVR